MPIIQDAFFITDDIATGLATGKYRRYGSVIRYATGHKKGRIVTHLEHVDLKTIESQHLGLKALHFIAQHKKGAITTASVAAIVTTGAFIYNKKKTS